ncbi:hypothetical protein A3D06_00010 [Candidatus Roizmanbacteria bacterium RIFCSPHIGHO2_02_FULL_40_9]|uniref:Sporulation stage II protein D amidase enhancer LytB N-terminal domain-containing protein n=1 Tax=Candidatus Roizmanbacteria bacterium RIFCSPHIGHO2_02_FULL_40_9 TaxID=1802042 RepID=A0A1F7HEX0_9BACT|nr:MAG: hypothetical protein A3D06_00010 [Candidatus Roizmanbacteria bacterium RIFCSPHIGHO2_02_FULL_40_9]
MRKIFIFIMSIIMIFSAGSSAVIADELDDIGRELGQLSKALEDSQKATKPLEEDLNKLRQRLSNIQSQITLIGQDIARKEKQIALAERDLMKQKELIDNRINAHYKNIKKTQTTMLDLLVTTNLSESLQNFFYQKKAADNDKQTILKTVLYIKNIDDAKEKLANEKGRLAVAKKTADEQSAFLSQEVGKAKAFQADINKKIAELSTRQQQLIAQKFGSLNLPQSLGAGPLYCTDDRNRNPGFSPAFAFFTFGIPHRVGMSQYGALGRAKAGQNAETILNAYFANIEIKKDYDQGIQISVDGYGTYSIEDYVKRIYEIPASWPLEALKAQAIAARSYALAYTNNGSKSICATQSCQVFKQDEKGGAWNQAVDETKGWVMIQGGQPISAWFASTAGGYTFQNNDVWGGSHRTWTKRFQDNSGPYNSFQDVINNAYDKESPCMYSAQGWRAEYDKSAWLKSEEVADIANIIMLAQKDSSTQNHLSQVDKANPDGTDTWDKEKVKSELKSRGGSPLNSVSDISVSADFGVGRTTSVTVSGDGGSATFDANTWKDYFNLRAPANIQIVGPLFNVERK